MPVDVRLDIPASTGNCHGTFAGADLNCTWRLPLAAHQWAPDVPGSAHAVYGGERAELRAWFHLAEDFRFEHATIDGDFADHPISILVRALPSDNTDQSLRINGLFAGSGLSLSCTFSPGSANLTGSVDGNALDLEAKRA